MKTTPATQLANVVNASVTMFFHSVQRLTATPTGGGPSMAYVTDNELGPGGQYGTSPAWRQEFVAFLDEVVATQPAERPVHVILDNFSTHRTDLVKTFLRQHPNVTFHFTPTYSSWLNQVESWFSKLQRDVIDRGIFTSVADLKRKILRYIRLYQKTAKPFQWKYSDVRKRIPAW